MTLNGIVIYGLLLALVVYVVVSVARAFPAILAGSKDPEARKSDSSNSVAMDFVRLVFSVSQFIGLLVYRAFLMLAKTADKSCIKPEDAASKFFRFKRFVILAATRGVLLIPIILYSHFPTVFTNLTVLPQFLVIFLGYFCIAVFIVRSFLDAFSRRGGPGVVFGFLYYIIGAYMVILWYPMFYIVGLLFWWFFPLLAVVAAGAVYFAARTKRPILSVALQVLVIPSCAAFIPAMEAFTIPQPCETLKANHAVEYYLNYCDESRQLIPRGVMETQLTEKQRSLIKMRHRTALQTGNRVFIGASIDFSFAYDFDTKRITPLNPPVGIFSMFEDKTSGLLFVASPQDGAMNVFNSRTLEWMKTFDYGTFGSPYWLEADSGSHLLFVGFGETTEHQALIYRMNSLELVKTDKLKDGFGGSVVETDYSKDTGTVYFVVLFNQNFVGAYDLNSMKLRQERKLPWFVLAVCFNPGLNALFVTSPLYSFGHGGVVALDPVTLETKRQMDVPVGSRDIVFGSDGLMYVANYLTGEIYKIDWQRRKILDSVQVGRKIKRMEYSPELNCLMFSSERGYARIDLGKWVTAQ